MSDGRKKYLNCIKQNRRPALDARQVECNWNESTIWDIKHKYAKKKWPSTPLTDRVLFLFVAADQEIVPIYKWN